MNYFLSQFYKHFCIIFAFIFILLDTICAVEKLDTTKVYSIGEITVTEKYRNTEIRSSTPLQIFDSEKLKKLNVLQLSDAVKYFSGVLVKDYGGIGGLKTISVRSLGSAHTAVSYDGITLTDCQTGQIDIGRFSLDNIEMLSLNNGQSDNIYQPARMFASSSVLNIRTLSPQFDKKNLYGKVSFKSGSYGLINPTLSVNKKINNIFSFSLSSEWLSSNGKYPYILNYSYNDNGLISNEIRKNSDVKNLRLEGTLYARFSESESGYFKTYFYNSQRGLPGATILYNEAAFSSQRIWDNTFFTQAHYKKDLSKILSFQINAKYNHGYLHYLDTAVLNNAGFEESFFTQNEYYSSFSLLYKALPSLSFSISSDGIVNDMFAKFENPNLTSDFAYPVRYSLLSVFAAKYVSNFITANASLLSTLVNETNHKTLLVKSYSRLTPYFGISFKPLYSKDIRFRAFYKNIFRLPSFNDLYYSRVGNANLIPESSNQFNLGVTFSDSPFNWLPLISFTVDAYHNTVKDKIVAMPTKNIFVWSMVNLGKVQITGLDLTAETSFFPWEDTGFTLGATYTYQRALDISSTDSNTYLHQIPYTPRISGSYKIALETKWINLAYNILWSGARYSGYQNYSENRLPAYSDHSFSANHDIKMKDKILSINLEVLNLLNENYAVVKWFPMPGRSVRGTFSLKF